MCGYNFADLNGAGAFFACIRHRWCWICVCVNVLGTGVTLVCLSGCLSFSLSLSVKRGKESPGM